MSAHKFSRSSFLYNPKNGVCYRNLKFLGFPDYVVSDRGDVFSRIIYGSHPSKIGPWWKMKPRNIHGRPGVVLHHAPEKPWQVLVHVLVLLAFVGPRPPKYHACHFPDRNPLNNRLENLRWDTCKANHEDARKHGTRPMGDTHYNAKVTDEQVKEIRRRAAEGKHGIQKQLAKEYGISPQNINGIVCRRQQKHII